MAAAVTIAQETTGQDALAARPATATRFLAAPSLLVALCFAVGDAAGHWVWIQPGRLLIALALLFAASAAAAYRAERVGPGAAGILCVAVGLFCAEVQPRPPEFTPLRRIADASLSPSPAARRRGFDGRHALEGTIERLSSTRTMTSLLPYSSRIREEQSRQIDLRVTQVDGKVLPAPEGLRLTLYAPPGASFPDLACGQSLDAKASLHTAERFVDPGVWDAGTWLRQQGIAALGSAHAEDVTVSVAKRPAGLMCGIHDLQQRASDRLVRLADAPGPRWMPAALRLSGDDAVMLSAMLTGDRTLLGRRLRVGFERTGSFHLLVVSGMHLAIFAGLVFWIARRLRLSRTWASIATMALAFVYALFTGFAQPVQRAFWMVALYLVGRLLWRERQALNAIGFAALVMLVASPRALLDAGFQMTLLSVLAVAGIAVPAAEKTFGPLLRATRDLWLIPADPGLPIRVAQFRVTLRLFTEIMQPLLGRRLALAVFPRCVRLLLLALELLTTSLAIEVLMALPMALYFHRITAVALPVNLVIIPLLGLLLPLAFLTSVLLLLLPKLAVFSTAAVALLLHGVRALVQLFGGLRLGDIRIPAPQGSTIAIALLLTAAAFLLIRMRRFGLPSAAAVLALSVAVIMHPRPVLHRAGALEISTIDVGQGDSLLLITPGGKTLLVDAGGIAGGGGLTGGTDDGSSSNFDVGEDVVSPVLWSRGIRRLDAVAITHAHADHIGGMRAVLANFRPHVLWVGINPHSALYDAVLQETQETGTAVVQHTAGEVFDFGGVRVRVLAPAADYHPAAAPGNNDSLVLQMRYGQTTALLEGDAEAPSEDRMLAEGQLHADFLKVGHHGSRTSTTPEFLAAVSPAWAAISVGRRNFYGHPSANVLQELESSHVQTFRTDLLGLSTFYLDGSAVHSAVWAAER